MTAPRLVVAAGAALVVAACAIGKPAPHTTTYVIDTATPLTMVLSETTGTQTTYYWQGLDTLAQKAGSTPQYIEYDGLGSVRQLTDSGGVVQLAQTFDPYGNGFSSASAATTRRCSRWPIAWAIIGR